MELYYQDSMVQIWNGDSRRLPMVADDSVGLVLTSPPYWDGSDYRHPNQIGFGQSYDEFSADLQGVLRECFRCLGPGRRIAMWVSDLFFGGARPPVPLSADVHRLLQGVGFEFETTIFWHSARPESTGGETPPFLTCGRYPAGGPQHLVVYQKPGKTPQPAAEVLAASTIPAAYRSRLENPVWLSPEKGGPSSLGEEWFSPEGAVIRFWTLVGDVMLEPFAGAGSFCAAAKRLGRRAIGIELNAKTCEEAAEQCRNATSPMEEGE